MRMNVNEAHLQASLSPLRKPKQYHHLSEPYLGQVYQVQLSTSHEDSRVKETASPHDLGLLPQQQ